MNTIPYIGKRTAMATAIALTLGTAAPLQTASAAELTFSWTGLFTMLDPGGVPLQNTSYPYYGDPTWGYGLRTQISGTFVYDTSTGAGTLNINPFDFFSSGPAVAHDVVTQTIGDGSGGLGTLMAGSLLFDWSVNTNINVGIIFDADGLLADLGNGYNVGDIITGGATPASNAVSKSKYPIGAAPIATTTYNTDFHNDSSCVATDTCIISNDAIGGDPMDNGPFPNFSANFDITSMTLISDGTGPVFTPPADPNALIPEPAVPGNIVSVNLGGATVAPDDDGDSDPTNDQPDPVEPCTVTVQYDAGSGWTADNGTNAISVTLDATTTTLTVDWRATTTANDPNAGCAVSTTSLDTQTVTVTIDDNTAPSFGGNVPADFSIDLLSTADTVTFEGPTSGHGTIAASDAVDSAPLIEWSINDSEDSAVWTANTADDESSSDFGSGVNIIYWRVTDDAGNQTIYEQRVTVNLPAGIVGSPCNPVENLTETDLERMVEGVFQMRDPGGAPTGEIDEGITGTLNPAVNCGDTACTDSGAQLFAGQPFYGSTWNTETIRLFDQPGTYTFDTCPGSNGATTAPDGSIACDADNTLSMTVGPNQLGAHMLFNWSVNRKIDVVVVWDYECGATQLTATDPDGDGDIGTKMVDGPFQGFSAAFNLIPVDGEDPFTTGGFAITVGAVNNPVDGESPLPVEPGSLGSEDAFTAAALSAAGVSDDSGVVTSCSGGCYDFTVSGRTPGETIQVVLPLSAPIPYYSLYRKYDPASGTWANFVVNGTDNVKTAPLNDDGTCPTPGAADYAAYSSTILADMLRPDDQCVQLTITDNGPNDSDPTDGVIADPSGVGVTSAPAAPEAATSGGGGCTLSTTPAAQRLDLWLLAGVMGLLGLRRKARQQ